MKKAIFGALILPGALVALPATAFSQGMGLGLENLSWYGGAGVGAGEVDTDDIEGETGAFGQVDDESTAFKAFVGANVNEVFAVEAGYLSFGEAEDEDNDDDVFDEGTSFDADGFTTAVVGNWPVTERFLVHGKVGALFWEADTRVGQVSGDEDGTDAFYGVGATYEFTEQWAARVEYDRYQLDDTDVDTLFASAVFSF